MPLGVYFTVDTPAAVYDLAPVFTYERHTRVRAAQVGMRESVTAYGSGHVQWLLSSSVVTFCVYTRLPDEVHIQRFPYKSLRTTPWFAVASNLIGIFNQAERVNVLKVGRFISGEWCSLSKESRVSAMIFSTTAAFAHAIAFSTHTPGVALMEGRAVLVTNGAGNWHHVCDAGRTAFDAHNLKGNAVVWDAFHAGELHRKIFLVHGAGGTSKLQRLPVHVAEVKSFCVAHGCSMGGLVERVKHIFKEKAPQLFTAAGRVTGQVLIRSPICAYFLPAAADCPG